jgi:hypothetical protein
MFRKRAKKTYPPGTFIPTPARIFAILQLCIAFSILLWNASLPFMGDLYEIKSKLLIYKHVINHPQFAHLSPLEQESIQTAHTLLQAQLGHPFWHKLSRSFTAIVSGIPSLELAWILFSVVLSIMLLKKVEGAANALWILPLLTLAYACENQWQRLPASLTEEQKLFPSEKLLLENYLAEPFSPAFELQQKQLKQAWDAYLVKEWTAGSGTPEEGFFFFNRARLKTLENNKIISSHPRESLLAIALYLFWNFSYAFVGFTSKSRCEPRFAV